MFVCDTDYTFTLWPSMGHTGRKKICNKNFKCPSHSCLEALCARTCLWNSEQTPPVVSPEKMERRRNCLRQIKKFSQTNKDLYSEPNCFHKWPAGYYHNSIYILYIVTVIANKDIKQNKPSLNIQKVPLHFFLFYEKGAPVIMVKMNICLHLLGHYTKVL